MWQGGPGSPGLLSLQVASYHSVRVMGPLSSLYTLAMYPPWGSVSSSHPSSVLWVTPCPCAVCGVFCGGVSCSQGAWRGVCCCPAQGLLWVDATAAPALPDPDGTERLMGDVTEGCWKESAEGMGRQEGAPHLRPWPCWGLGCAGGLGVVLGAWVWSWMAHESTGRWQFPRMLKSEEQWQVRARECMLGMAGRRGEQLHHAEVSTGP